MKRLTKWGLSLTVALIAVVGGFTTAQAATKTKDLPEYTTYVRTKRAMTIGAKEKTKTGYKTIHIKKNRLLAVNETETRGKTFKEYATFTLGDVHYAKVKRVTYSRKFIRFNTKNFKYIKALRAPIRTQLLRQGKGFVMSTAWINRPTYSPVILVTLDNYLQTYSKAKLAKIDEHWMLPTADGDFAKVKPTDTVKISKLTKRGTTYTIDYKRPLKGFADRKIGKHHYRLTIKQLGRQQQNYTPIDDTYDTAASWVNYTINAKPYFAGSAEWGLD